MKRFFAQKTVCSHGHKHDSKAESARCEALHLMERAGEITHLEVFPKFDFVINGEPLKMANGQCASWKLDFAYRTETAAIAEDVKSKGKFMDSRELPLKRALFRLLYRGWELREVRA